MALVDSFYLAGSVVYLDHGQGQVTAYFHVDPLSFMALVGSPAGER